MTFYRISFIHSSVRIQENISFTISPWDTDVELFYVLVMVSFPQRPHGLEEFGESVKLLNLGY